MLPHLEGSNRKEFLGLTGQRIHVYILLLLGDGAAVSVRLNGLMEVDEAYLKAILAFDKFVRFLSTVVVE